MPYKLGFVDKITILEISSQVAGRREDKKITGLARRILRYGKLKLILIREVNGLKRMILRKQDNVFLFEFGLIVPVVQKYIF